MSLARHAGLMLLPVALLGLTAIDCGNSNHHAAAPTATPVGTSTPLPTATPTVPCPLPSPFCGGDFPLNTIETTPYGPAWADVVLDPDQFVPCFGPYALCYYSDCTLADDGSVSECPCFEWYGVSFVLMSGILNLDSYQATVSQCTADPASCQVPNGAPVCGDINNGTFFNSARNISTFSFYNASVEPIGLTDCSTQPGLYSGCMTAPCFGEVIPKPDGAATIMCECPNFDGPFQIGKSGLSCQDSAQMTWSAAFHPNLVPPNPCDLVGDGACIPDAPPPCGCPLYDPGSTVLPPGSGVDCDLVCNQYASCRRDNDLELGFTCDATLCTTHEHALLLDACGGLEQCSLAEIFKAETAAGCSCCASQLCGCDPNAATDTRIFELNAAQRVAGDVPQCDVNGTLCGTAP